MPATTSERDPAKRAAARSTPAKRATTKSTPAKGESAKRRAATSRASNGRSSKRDVVKKVPSARRSGNRGPANRQALLAAAHRLVGERGDRFTTQDLIKEADVALQTFYRHFAGGKDQILLAVLGDLVAGHCESLAVRAERIDDPVERLHLYITGTLATLVGEPGAAAGARFMTSQHWRLHQELPGELEDATKPFADLVQRELEAGRDAGVLAPRNAERDAWMINRLVMSTFHHYAFAEDDESLATAADDVWAFCLVAVGGTWPVKRRRGSRR